MKTANGLMLVVLFAMVVQSQSQGDPRILRLRSIEGESLCAPTEHLQATVELKRVEGVAIMKQGVFVDSPEDEDPACDILRFVLTNHGSETIEFSAPYDRTETPWLTFEAFVDDKWTQLIPYVTSDGKRGRRGGMAYKYATTTFTIAAGGTLYFPLYVEHWRYSVASKLRISLSIRSHAVKAKEEEVVYSNSFSVKP